LLARHNETESSLDEARQQIAGLEAELKEEKEGNENLSEPGNDRRDQINKLEEQVEEASERYEEAKWRLKKAQHFERLVRRRKGLIRALIEALKAKKKANTALKAGLDGLRTHKAAAEANQQKLLARLETLKNELGEAQESLARHHGATLAKEQLVTAEARAQELESRLNTQAELIQSLEADLKAARQQQRSTSEKDQEIERLQAELASKTEIVGRLQADVDEQQRKLAKLRGSESETMRLKTIADQDKTTIDALQREIAQLREALARNGNGAAAPADTDERLKERDRTISRLTKTVK